MKMQQNDRTKGDATADAQLVMRTDDAENNINCRALIDLCASESISLDVFRKKLAPFFPSNRSEQLDLLRHICTNPLVTIEMLQCIIEFTPKDAATMSENLFTACRSGNLEHAKWIIEDNARHGMEFPSIISVLVDHQLIVDGVALALLKLLLDSHREIVRDTRINGDSLLHTFATINIPRSTDISFSLIEAFPNLALEPDNVGLQPLHRACMAGNSEFVKCILEMCPDAINGESRDHGLQPLHMACVAGNLESIKCILEICPDAINGVSRKEGFQPLHMACVSGRLDVVKCILEMCPDAINGVIRDQGLQPLHIACMNGFLDVIKCILEMFPDAINGVSRKEGYQPLHMACANGFLDVVKCILEMCPDAINGVSRKEGYQPLHMACAKGFSDVVKCILEMCPDAINGESRDQGLQPLHMACMNGRLDVVKCILGMCPNAINGVSRDQGLQPLHMACANGFLDVVKFILEMCPDAINGVSRDHGLHPIHVALANGSLDLVKCILEMYPFVINNRTRSGFSVVDCVASLFKGSPQEALSVTRYLLEVYPDWASPRIVSGLLLYTCRNTDASNLIIGLELITLVYNACPQAIIKDETQFRQIIGSDDHEDAVKVFIAEQLKYAEQARDIQLSYFHFHNALRDRAPLGSIKLFVEADPSTTQSRDSSGSLPLHIVCENYDCPDVAKYLLELDSMSIMTVDHEGDTPLHCACRAAKYELIEMIFAQHSNPPVRRMNSSDDLPIHLLVHNQEEDDSTGYLSCLFLFLKADPELLQSRHV